MGAYIIVVAVLAAVVGYLVGRSTAARADYDAGTVDSARREIATLRALVADLKDTAWDHRELDSNLATIIIDEIRSYERRQLE